jgi:transcriptional regulator with XRE-family HTH domain
MPGDYSELGKRLRRYRRAADQTQEELAERAGLSVRGLSDLERGARRAPRRETLDALAEALDLSPDDRADLIATASRAATSGRRSRACWGPGARGW